MLENPLNNGKNMFAGDTKTQIWARDVFRHIETTLNQ